MITLYRAAGYAKNNASELAGLSTETKPMDVKNGTWFHEMDTSKQYRFDAENKKWLEQKTATPVDPEPDPDPNT